MMDREAKNWPNPAALHTSPETHQTCNIAGITGPVHTKLNASKARNTMCEFQDSPLSTRNEIMLDYKLF